MAACSNDIIDILCTFMVCLSNGLPRLKYNAYPQLEKILLIVYSMCVAEELNTVLSARHEKATWL